MKKLMVVVGILLLSMFLVVNSAIADNATLLWDANSEPDMAAYKVYYGVSSGEPYDGKIANEGESPIIIPIDSLSDAANPTFKVTGLDKKFYYFTVTAYDEEGFESGYSEERILSDRQPPEIPTGFKLLFQ